MKQSLANATKITRVDFYAVMVYNRIYYDTCRLKPSYDFQSDGSDWITH